MSESHGYRIEIRPARRPSLRSPEAAFLDLLERLQNECLEFDVVAETSSPWLALDDPDRHIAVDLAIASSEPRTGTEARVAAERVFRAWTQHEQSMQMVITAIPPTSGPPAGRS